VVKFLHERIKVNKKTNNLGDVVKINGRDTFVDVESSTQMSKRYMKYLVKKYLKQQNLRDMMRVIATSKDTYKVVFLAIEGAAEDAEEAGDEAADDEKMEE